MKVLLHSTKITRLRGGAEVFSEHLKKAFSDLSIIDYNAAKNDYPYLGFNFSAFKEPLRAYVVEKYFLKKISKYDPEVIFVNGMYGWYFNFKKIDVPVICILHGGHSAFAINALRRSSPDYYRTKYIYGYFEKISARNATVRISNSGFTQTQIKKHYNLDSRVIYNAVDTQLFKPMPKEDARESIGLPPNKKIAIFVGRPDYSKGFDIILKLAEIHKEIIFLCVINPPIKSEGNLMVKSDIPQNELPLFYSAADFLIFPSRFEGFGYVPLEALACNTPIIGSKTGILTEIAPTGSWIVEGEDYKKYSSAISDVLNLEKSLKTREFVELNFSFERFRKEYRRLVEEVLV